MTMLVAHPCVSFKYFIFIYLKISSGLPTPSNTKSVALSGVPKGQTSSISAEAPTVPDSFHLASEEFFAQPCAAVPQNNHLDLARKGRGNHKPVASAH